MKLFVWEGVLCDYTCGVVVALAPDLETALAQYEKERGWWQEKLGAPTTAIDLEADPQPAIWSFNGGG